MYLLFFWILTFVRTLCVLCAYFVSQLMKKVWMMWRMRTKKKVWFWTNVWKLRMVIYDTPLYLFEWLKFWCDCFKFEIRVFAHCFYILLNWFPYFWSNVLINTSNEFCSFQCCSTNVYLLSCDDWSWGGRHIFTFF